MSTSDHIPAKKAPLYTIRDIATLTGLSPSILRIWELRYQWPKPLRAANRYRRYTDETLADLQWIANELKAGRVISTLIENGKPRIPSPDRRVARRKVIDFSDISLPHSSEAQRLRQQLEAAIQRSDVGLIARLEAQAPMLHPSEREAAVWGLIRKMRDG